MHDVILFDGVCGLCNRVVRFVLRRDPDGAFRFAPLQGEFAAAALARPRPDAPALSTVVVVVSPGAPEERLLTRSRAALHVMRRLGGGWRCLSAVLSVFPSALLDVAYRAVARVRYRIFGRFDACPVPAPEHRARFLP